MIGIHIFIFDNVIRGAHWGYVVLLNPDMKKDEIDPRSVME